MRQDMQPIVLWHLSVHEVYVGHLVDTLPGALHETILVLTAIVVNKATDIIGKDSPVHIILVNLLVQAHAELLG